jgi:hypothetical protein
MAAKYTLLGNALTPVFATTGLQLPFIEPGSSDRHELWIRVERQPRQQSPD